MKAVKALKTRATKAKKGIAKKSAKETVVTNGSTTKQKTPKESKSNGKVKTTKKKSSLHKKDLEGLKDLDPEFYSFLKQNDKELLDFNLYDSDDDDDDEAVGKDGDEAQDGGKEQDDEKYHQPEADLEVASDESDFEDEDEPTAKDGRQKVTLNQLRQWQRQLAEPNVSIEPIRSVVQAFSAALAGIASDDNEGGTPSMVTPFQVVGAAAFNGIVQLCVLHLQPAVQRFLRLNSGSRMPLHKTRKWVKVRGCLRCYLTDLIRLVEHISNATVLRVLLKHLHQMAGMVAPFHTLGKKILKRLIVLWATGDETVRVLAFLCVLKITRNQQLTMLHHVLKAMYLSYVRNSKFVSPTTLPGINFMRRSLVEMFALDLNASYQHAFLYIRQLAIHLRNAVILKKKDSVQAVYNWQFVNSLRLWSDLLASTADKPQLQPLIYPLITITMGVIRLVPTAQYFPLRFHCIQTLISLSRATRTFVPLLPLILEVLSSSTFNRKHTAVSMKPLPFTCVLRLNKTQLAENGFRDEVVEQVCSLTLEYLSDESASIGYSDLIVPSVAALRGYLKTCRNSKHSRKLKQLLDKILENGRFIDQERRKITFGLQERAAVQAWETTVREKGTPLAIYYSSWVRTHETKKRRLAAQTDAINDDYGVPSIKRQPKRSDVMIRNDDGEVELFPSDSEGEDNIAFPAGDDSAEEDIPKKRKKAVTKGAEKKKKAKREKLAAVVAPVAEADEDDGADDVDIVKDLDMDDW